MSINNKLKRFSFRLPQGAESMLSVVLFCFDMLLLHWVFKETFVLWFRDIGPVDDYFASYERVKWYLFTLYAFFGLFVGLFNLRTLNAASDILFHCSSALLTTFISFNLIGFMSRSFASLSHTFPRPVMLIATGVSIFVTFIIRIIVSRIFRPHPEVRKAIIIGNEEEGKHIIRHFHRRGGVRFRIVSIMKSDEADNLANEVVFKHAHEIFVTDTEVNLDKFWAQIYYGRKEEPHKFNVRIKVDASKATGTFGLRSLEDFPLITICSQPLSKIQCFAKRLFDICFASFAILITSPVMLLTAILVKLDSPGPVFYKQKRVGLNGKEYNVIKFRSMRTDSEAASGPVISTSDDPRVSKFGKFIRKFGIDELPQFFLVLTGEMSVVGPRPERPFFVNDYYEFQGRRLSVKPGVTGLAAVNSRYYLKLTDKVTYDYYYLDYYSLLLDIKIIFQTVWVLLFEPNYSN